MNMIYPCYKKSFEFEQAICDIKSRLLDVINDKGNSLYLVEKNESGYTLNVSSRSDNYLYYNAFCPDININICELECGVRINYTCCLQNSTKKWITFFMFVTAFFEFGFLYSWICGKLFSIYALFLPLVIFAFLLVLTNVVFRKTSISILRLFENAVSQH